MMDIDLDFSLNPSGIIYGARAIMLDPVNQDGCFLGGLNALCIGITEQQSEFAPGVIGNTTPPFILAQPGDNSKVGVYGPGRNCLWDVDPAFGGLIKPGQLLISSNSGYATLASPFGPWNQWVLAIARSFGVAGYSVYVKIIGPFAWSPTGS